MDSTSVSAQCAVERQDALITEIAPLAREFARQFVRRGSWDDLAQDVVLECLEQIRAGEWPSDVASLPAYITGSSAAEWRIVAATNEPPRTETRDTWRRSSRASAPGCCRPSSRNRATC